MHSSLELGIFFLEEATSSSFGDKTISLLMSVSQYANRVRAVAACHALRHALRSRAGGQGFRSEIGYQIFDQV